MVAIHPAAVPATKRAVRGCDRAAWAVHAKTALNLESAAAVRKFCRQTIAAEEQGS